MSETWHAEHVDETPQRSTWKLNAVIAVGLLAVGGGVAALWWFKQSPEVPPVAAPVAPTAVVAPEPPKLSIPEGEALLKQLAGSLSSAKEFASWLAEPDVLRRLVAGTTLIAEGKSPSNVWAFLKPEAAFQVVTKRKHVHASPKSGARYDTFTRVVTSIDPDATAKVYVQLKPYLEVAYSEIGAPGKSFDGSLRDAVQSLASVQVPKTEPELQAKGLGYVYKDAGLESLNAAQKQLLRTGLPNARLLEAWLAKFAGSLQR